MELSLLIRLSGGEPFVIISIFTYEKENQKREPELCNMGGALPDGAASEDGGGQKPRNVDSP
jgi:hypothetical protein